MTEKFEPKFNNLPKQESQQDVSLNKEEVDTKEVDTKEEQVASEKQISSHLKEEKATIRVFSKEYHIEERKAAFEKIRVERASYFSRVKSTQEKIAKLVEQATQKKLDSERVVNELKSIESDIIEQEDELITKIFSFFRGERPSLRKLKMSRAEKLAELENLTQQYIEFNDLISAAQTELNNKEELLKAKRILQEFYADQSQKYNQFIEEQTRVRSVENIIKKYNVVFVHGIHPDFIPIRNSLLMPGVDWQTKLDIIIALNPSISTSTIKSGDGPNNMWVPMGVLINGGSIIEAFEANMATQPKNLSIRGRLYSPIDPKKIEWEIDRSIRFRGDQSLNELTIFRPQICGAYICREKQPDGTKIKIDPPDPKVIIEFAKECKQRGIPVYEIIKGELWETEYDEGKDKIVPKKLIRPDDLTRAPYKISQGEREQALRRILENSPFKAIPEEAKYINYVADGREKFIEMYIQSLPADVTSRFEEGKVLADFPRIGGRELCVKKGKKFFWRVERVWKSGFDTRGGRVIGKREPIIEEEVDKVAQHFGFGRPYIEIGHLNYEVSGKSGRLENPDDYLFGMEYRISKYIQEMKETIIKLKNPKEIRRQTRFYLEEVLRPLACHCLGFGIQAGELGDKETMNKAFQIASQIISKEEYDQIAARRIDASGRLRITEKDLETMEAF
jgi:hypothetical protein